jgi:serine protease Do
MRTLTSHIVAAAVGAALLLGPAFAQPAAPRAPAPAVGEPRTGPSFSPLVESVKSAVVNVEVRARVRGGPAGLERFGGDPFEHFFGGPRGGAPREPREQVRPSAGSGFLIDPGGIIVTNNHVVENAVSITVKLDDGRTFKAEVVGRDPLTDVAVIRLQGKVDNLPWVKLGNSNAMKVGDWVVAIGNPFGLASSVSAGIVSATARNIRAGPYDEFIQTDAAINPGNSGGPLFNLGGQVIGMNTAIVGGGTGIGFAVPSNVISSLLPQLQKEGRVTRGYLGVQIQDLDPDLATALGVPEQEGAIVADVTVDSPAHGQLQPDDVVVAIDEQKVTSTDVLTRTVAMHRPGTTVKLRVYRDGKPREVPVKLGVRPDLEKLFTEEPKSSGSTEAQRQQKVGMSFRDMDPRFAQGMRLPKEGALIQEVTPGSPAEKANLRAGMVVVEAGGKPVKSAQDLALAVRGAKPGAVLLLRVAVPEGARFLRALKIPQ